MDERTTFPAAEHQPPYASAESTPGSGGLDDPRALQILSTEHWSLLSARSLVYNESFARAGMFLTFLSASLVAVAFVGSAMQFDRVFLVLAAMLLFFDLVIGLATLGRMVDAALDDLRSIAAMNRIRNAYVQVAPAVLPFLSTSTHDDAMGVLQTYGQTEVRGGRAGLLHGLSTAGGMIGTIDALIAGVLAGVVAILLGFESVIAFAAGGLALVGMFAFVNRYAYRQVLRYQATAGTRFPSPPDGGAAPR